MQEINASIDFDKALFAAGHRRQPRPCPHAGRSGHHFGGGREADRRGPRHDRGRDRARDSFTFSRELEDIHMHVEARLRELIGDPAGRLHTARSRNDQVATDLRLWVRERASTRSTARSHAPAAGARREGREIRRRRDAGLHAPAERPARHLRPSPSRLCRDVCARPRPLRRLPQAAERIAARRRGARRHRVSDRPRARRPRRSASTARRRTRSTPSPTAISRWRRWPPPRSAAVHLSRFAEEIVLWATPQFGFVQLSDRFTTGSSIMPQKRNPDAAELVRAKTGRIIGDLDRAARRHEGPAARLFEGHAGGQGAGLRRAAEPVAFARRDDRHGPGHDARPRDDARSGRRPAMRPRPTSPTGWCARPGCPSAKRITSSGGSSRKPRRRGVALEDLPLEAMQAVHPTITQAVYGVLSVEASVASRTSYGGTAPENVRSGGARLDRSPCGRDRAAESDA